MTDVEREFMASRSVVEKRRRGKAWCRSDEPNSDEQPLAAMFWFTSSACFLRSVQTKQSCCVANVSVSDWLEVIYFLFLVILI